MDHIIRLATSVVLGQIGSSEYRGGALAWLDRYRFKPIDNAPSEKKDLPQEQNYSGSENQSGREPDTAQ